MYVHAHQFGLFLKLNGVVVHQDVNINRCVYRWKVALSRQSYVSVGDEYGETMWLGLCGCRRLDCVMDSISFINKFRRRELVSI